MKSPVKLHASLHQREPASLCGLHEALKTLRIIPLLLLLLLGIDASAITCEPKNASTGFFGVSVSRARYYNPQIGRFWTMDTYEGSQSDPLSLHKYLYAADNPVNLIDPSGNSFGDVMTSLYIKANLMAASFLATAGSYGAAETTLAIMALGYYESLNQGNYGTAAVMLGVDAFTMGQGGRIMRFPGWTKLTQLKDWMRILHAEHVADAPASRKAMAAALQFSEDIVQGSLKVGGKGAQGADIVAEAMVNGTVQTLKREVSVFNGKLTNLYGKICDEGFQTEGAQIRQVFIQIADEIKSNPNWKQSIASQVQNARTYLGNVTIYIVDREGRSVL